MEKNLETNLQYQRGSSVVISGIPITVIHTELEGIVIKLFNAVCEITISGRDLIACHRISKSSPRVLVKFLNKKDAISLLGVKLTVNRLKNEDIGLGYCDKLFIEDHLTPYISNLAYQCRCLKCNQIIVRTKVIKGVVKILMSTDDGTLKWFDILHTEDIIGHFPDFVSH